MDNGKHAKEKTASAKILEKVKNRLSRKSKGKKIKIKARKNNFFILLFSSKNKQLN
ncbi:MAG: hypothetical protein ABF750_04255 [Oenococcus oeni]|uniref:hypothetical protein n=1 Tax=Oenococcus oeni TaxID=1247 RepID=UPI000A55FB54|nr:hypothetical protein [Oenococcus oeni]